MADTSLRLPGNAIGAPVPPAVPSRRQRAGARRRAVGSVSPTAVAGVLWRALWFPYWFGSDVPAPALPRREARVPDGIGLAGEQVVRTLDRLRRRIWLSWALTVLVRGAWLGGLVGVGWLIWEQAGGPAFDGETLLRISVVVFAIGFVFAALLRPSRRRTARMLDRSFRLHERMTTAIENLGRGVPPPGVRAEIVYLQIADAANVVADLRRHSAFRVRLPVRELVLALAFALLLAALFFLRGVGGGIPDLAAAGVPPFTPAANRQQPEQQAANPAAAAPNGEQAPTTAEVRERAARSNEAQRDLATLGQALDDHAATSQVADAIARGDYDAAAEELRDLSANANDLSQESREALADDLDAAADDMSEGSGELAQATRDAASGLREGGEPAQQGVQNLGDAVQETGGDVVSQQELAGQMAAAQSAQESGTQSESGEPAEGGEQQADEPGESGDHGESGGQQAGTSGQSQGEPGEGQAGESGEQGGEAQPGESGSAGSQEGADRGNNPGQPQNQGQGEQRGRTGRSAAQPGQAGSQQPGTGSEGDPGSPMDQAGQPGEPGMEPGGDPQAGAGAGSGDSQQPGGEQAGAPPAGDEPGAGEGPPAEEQITTASVPDGAGGASDPRTADEAIQLDRSGGPGVQTGNDSGSASLGSGTGVMTGSGDTTQQEVGAAGPDSNRVPPEYRDLVEDYFSEPEAEG